VLEHRLVIYSEEQRVSIGLGIHEQVGNFEYRTFTCIPYMATMILLYMDDQIV